MVIPSPVPPRDVQQVRLGEITGHYSDLVTSCFVIFQVERKFVLFYVTLSVDLHVTLRHGTAMGTF